MLWGGISASRQLQAKYNTENDPRDPTTQDKDPRLQLIHGPHLSLRVYAPSAPTQLPAPQASAVAVPSGTTHRTMHRRPARHSYHSCVPSRPATVGSRIGA